MMSCKIVKAISLITIAAGLIVIAGWIFNIAVLKSIMPFWVPMRFVTAICFVFSGVIIFYVHRISHGESEAAPFVLAGSSLVILILMLTFLFSRIFNISLGIEELIIKIFVPAERGVVANQPSLATLLNFLIISVVGMGVLFRVVWFKIFVSLSGFIVGAIGTTGLIGYILNNPVLKFDWGSWSMPIAIHTTIVFILIGVALFLSGKNCINGHNGINNQAK